MKHHMKKRLSAIMLTALLAVTSLFTMVPQEQAKAAGALTVAQAIQSQNGGTITVTGIVVGHASGSQTANFKSPFANDFNVLLADSSSETNTSKLLDVQITSSYRSQFGLQSNPSLIGKTITVTGTAGTYNNFAGVKSPTAMTLGGDSTTPTPNPDPGTGLPDGTGKKVLFDNSHAQTAGAADWVIDGGFSDFASGLRAAGFTVESLERSIPYTFGEQAITYDKLKNYDVFVLAEPNVPFKSSEQAAMLQYVKAGGSIFFIGDHYNADRNKNRWDGSEAMNGYRRGAYSNPALGMSSEEANSPAMQGVTSSDWLGTNFGIRFRYNALGDVNATDIVAPAQSFGITQGVSSVAMHAGSTLAIIDPNKAKGIVYIPSGVSKWGSAVDQGVYNGGGRAEGPYAAISKLGAGKAAFIGDSSPVEDATPKYKREENGQTKKTYDGFKEVDDSTLLVNTVRWLAQKESYTDFTQVSGLTLDSKTSLLSIENPSTSTEPQQEPWAAPAAGYKWYDPTTFKSGSYGYVAS